MRLSDTSDQDTVVDYHTLPKATAMQRTEGKAFGRDG